MVAGRQHLSSCIVFLPISGDHSGVWFLDLKSGPGSAGQGEPPTKADVVMTMDSSDFTKMFAGELKRRDAGALLVLSPW